MKRINIPFITSIGLHFLIGAILLTKPYFYTPYLSMDNFFPIEILEVNNEKEIFLPKKSSLKHSIQFPLQKNEKDNEKQILEEGKEIVFKYPIIEKSSFISEEKKDQDVEVPLLLPLEKNNSDTSQQNSLFFYFSLIREKIEQNKIYPEVARKKGITGKVKLNFSILSNGDIREIKILSSSGNDILDNSAIETIKRIIPFPPFPKDLQKDSISFVITISYKLK